MTHDLLPSHKHFTGFALGQRAKRKSQVGRSAGRVLLSQVCELGARDFANPDLSRVWQETKDESHHPVASAWLWDG